MAVELKEQTTGYLTVTFLDKDGAAQQPTSATYRIDCLTTGQEIRADTGLAPADGVVEIVLTGADVALQVQANRREQRRVTVWAEYGGGQAVKDDYRYDVVNLGGVA